MKNKVAWFLDHSPGVTGISSLLVMMYMPVEKENLRVDVNVYRTDTVFLGQ
jgi:hypothetical protein